MVHVKLLQYVIPDSPLRKGPDSLSREQAVEVVECMEQGAREIFARQLRDFYVQSWKPYFSFSGDPADGHTVHGVCFRIFHEVQVFVSLRSAFCKQLRL